MANVFFDEFFKKRYIKCFVAYRKYFDNFLNRNNDISKIYTSLLRSKIIFHVIGNKKEALT